MCKQQWRGKRWLAASVAGLFLLAPRPGFSDDEKPVIPVPPQVETAPPSSSLLSLSLPYWGPDPLRVVMPQGPLMAAERDAKEIRQRMAEKGAPANPCQSLTLAGVEATRDQNYDAAEEFMRRARRAECDDGFAAFYLGVLYEFRGRYWQAIQILPLARAQLTQNFPEHRYVDFCDATLGRTYFRLNRFQEALFHLEKVLMKYPGDLPHTYYAGISYLKLGFSERGLNSLERVATLVRYTPNSKQMALLTYRTLAELYLQMGHLAPAEHYARLGLQLDGKSAPLQAILAQVMQAKNSGRYVVPPHPAP